MKNNADEIRRLKERLGQDFKNGDYSSYFGRW